MTALAIAIPSSAIGTAALAQDWRAPHPLASTDRYSIIIQEPRRNSSASGPGRQPPVLDTIPGLHEFLATHPVARNNWKSHPCFINREERYAERH